MKKFIKGLVIVGLVGIVGVASAALVSHLSNAVSINTSITSPFSMSINEGRDGTVSNNESLNINAYSGTPFTFTTVAVNNSDTNFDDFGYRVIVITAPDGQEFTGGEFIEVLVENKWSNGPQDITNDIYVVGSNGSLISQLIAWTGTSKRLVLITSDNGTDATKFSLEPNQSDDWNAFTITTNVAVKEGVYTIESQLVVDLAEYATYQYNR